MICCIACSLCCAIERLLNCFEFLPALVENVSFPLPSQRKTDKVARACWLQAFFENGQVLFPEKSLVGDYSTWQAMLDELLLFPQAEHDDLVDGLQTMMEGSMSFVSYGGCSAAFARSILPDDFFEDLGPPPSL